MLCSLSDLKFDLFYRYRFRQVSRLVYIQILSERSIIGNQLQHDSDREYGEAVVYIRNADSDVSQIVIHRITKAPRALTSRMLEMVLENTCS